MDTTAQTIQKLQQRIQTAQLPADLVEKLNDEVHRLEFALKSNEFNADLDRQITYINFVCDLPWNKRGQDILDLTYAKKMLDKSHFGLEGIKDRILEYLSVVILNQKNNHLSKQPVLAFVGLVGSGKTSLAYAIADSLGRPIVRIPFGGLGSALQLRGESRVKSEAEPGLIMKALKRAQVNNPVILLDELDRVAESARADIMGVLVELLDPEQNAAFLDHYVGYAFDLSQVLFVVTANNTGNIATAVMDRLELIEMPFYTDDQKVRIAKDYLLPKALENASIAPSLIRIDEAVWPAIVRPLGFDGGIRSLKRNIDSFIGKIARKIVEGTPGPFDITAANVREYIGV